MPSTKIRPLEEKDFSELAEFLKEGFGTSPDIWHRRFDMWWINNPWADKSIPYGWVIEDEKSEIVGFLGNVLVKYQIKGRDDLAAAGTSLYVRPSVRGVTSIQLTLSFDRQKNIKLLLHTTPNEIAAEIYSKFGSTDIDVPFNNLEYWHIRDYGKIFDLYVQTSIISHNLLPLMKGLLPPIKLISPIGQWFSDKRTLKPQPNHYKCSLCTDCGDSFTQLWENNRKENVTTLCRDAETLRWLYFSKAVADKRHLVKCTDTRNDELVAYFIFDIECPEKDIKIMKMKDAYIPQFEEEIILSLIEFSMNLAKKHNVAASVFWSFDQKMDEILKKRIKIKRKHKRPYLYYFVNEEDRPHLDGHEDHEFIPSPIDPDRGVI